MVTATPTYVETLENALDEAHQRLTNTRYSLALAHAKLQRERDLLTESAWRRTVAERRMRAARRARRFPVPAAVDAAVSAAIAAAVERGAP